MTYAPTYPNPGIQHTRCVLALTATQACLEVFRPAADCGTALKQQLAIDAPKVEFAEAVSDAEGGMTINQLAKVLRQRGIKHMGPHNLFQEMRKHGFLMRQRKHWNVPRQKYIEKGWFKIMVHLSPEDDGIQYETTDFAITGPGQLGLLAFFMDKYGISRQLSLLDGRRSCGARTVPAPKGGRPQ